MKDLLLWRQRLTSVFLIVMFSVFLLAVGSSGYTAITRFKFDLFFGICSIYLLLMAVISVALRQKGYRGRKLSAIHWCVLLFLLFCTLSAFLSSYFPKTLWGYHRYEGLITVSCYVLTFFCVSLFYQVKPWLIWIFAGAMTLFCAVCFLQFLGFNPLGLYPKGLNYYDAGTAYRYPFLGTVGNVGFVGALLSVAVPIFFVAIFRLQHKTRFLLLIPLLASLVVAVLMNVAAAFVGIGGSLLLLIPLTFTKNRRQTVLVWILILVVIFAGIAVIFFADIGSGTLHEFHMLLHGQWQDTFGTGRFYIWRNVLPLVKEHPLLGGGCDTLGQRMTAEFRRYDDNTGVTYRAGIDAAHNEYLNILVNEGLLALGAYLVALALSFILYVKKNKKHPLAAIWGSGVLGYSLQSFFGIRLCITAPYFWLCWALLLAALGEPLENTDSTVPCCKS